MIPIPEDAPFSGSQRMWLKGFFAGLGLPVPSEAEDEAGEDAQNSSLMNPLEAIGEPA